MFNKTNKDKLNRFKLIRMRQNKQYQSVIKKNKQKIRLNHKMTIKSNQTGSKIRIRKKINSLWIQKIFIIFFKIKHKK